MLRLSRASLVVALVCPGCASDEGMPPGGGDDASAGDDSTTAATTGPMDTGAESSSAGETGAPPSGWVPDPTWDKMELRFDGLQVPAEQTSYMCVGFTLATEQIRHMVAFDPVVDDAQVVHHMVLYKLQAPLGDGFISCFDMPPTTEVTWAWAPGGGPFELPPEAGFAFGDAGGQTHYALQIHYDNPLLETDHVDRSGVDVYVSQQLRPNAAGGLALGLVGGFEIPPGEPAYELTSTCNTQGFLNEPMHVFASMVHAHELGRSVWTEQFRGAELMGDVGRKDEYDFNDQAFQDLEIVVEPGDELVTHCIYDSTSRDTPTGFGLGTRDEMCFNYVIHYPKVALPFCG